MKTLESGIRLSVTARTSIVMDAWSRQQRISVHGWIYAIDNGLLRDLGVSITRPAEAPQQYAAAVRSLAVQQAAEKRLL